MGRFEVILRILHYAGLYLQLTASPSAAAAAAAAGENHITGNALFTEVPRDITAHSGEDVEMACSFRGAGSPSYSLEIQWWYMKDRRDWQGKPAQIGDNALSLEEGLKGGTKISVVKVAGSNISHKLRLSGVRPADEGTYECRVIDFSDTSVRKHRVRAFLQVEPAPARGSDVGRPAPRKADRPTGDRRPKRSSSACNDSCVL